MKIITPGNINRLKMHKRFECEYCGCVFLANVDEYSDYSSQHAGHMYIAECPCCNRPAWNYTDKYVCLED